MLHAAGARRVVEIGALRGETTVRMLGDLGADAELHVIDPEPQFDPAEHERAFPGRYHFHRGASLDVLPTLGSVDAALIDGDHNWYTVSGELRLLAEGARRHGTGLPVLVLHDVLWPYGRRDLYYAPERIPAEFRQPYAQAGVNPGMKRLHPRKGLNPTMWNAEEEGGPRNGVMTALEDFIAEHPRPVRKLVIPIYFGLAVVVEEDRLAAQPGLAAALDRLESSEGRHDLLEVAETTRLRAMVFQHTDHFRRESRADRAVARHLALLKDALLDRHYLENEVRLSLLTAKGQGRPAAAELRDPVRDAQDVYGKLERQRFATAGPQDVAATSFLPYTAVGKSQLDHLEASLDAVRNDGVTGDFVECGTGRGGGAIFMRAYLDAHEVPDTTVWVADRFRSSPEPEPQPSLPDRGVEGLQADLNMVRDGFARFDVLDDRVRFVQGPLEALLSEGPERIALLRVGRTVAEDARRILDLLYDRVTEGGTIVVDCGIRPSHRSRVEKFRADRGITAPLQPVDGSAVAWRKAADEATAPALAPVVSGVPAHPVLAPPVRADPVDLSVVVVFYNMRREAPRTLHSLSRAYQEGLGQTSYEVIVMENGSAPEQRLGRELVADFGPEFRYVDLGDEASPSPVGALNRGIAASRGRNLALMIDGAHVLTPGVLRFGLQGLATYAPAIVATQQWYVGPGQQGDAMANGYDQPYEDRLFRRIQWPSNGYRLFEIGHFVGERDWLDGVWESNCMFVSRAQLEQVGGFEERFAMPGGGYANLELYERLGSAPDVTVCSILGEGSFHQVHGGTTTNETEAEERRTRVHGYAQHYAELRGRAFRGAGKPIHFVGRIPTGAARRTKPRRLSAGVFGEAAEAVDGRPERPTPVPDDLRWSFTEAAWRNIPWRRTTWLGEPVHTAPTDLLAYQEILSRVRPDWVIEIGASDEGRARFLASICELTGHGQVLSLRSPEAPDPVPHPRLRVLAGSPSDPEVRRRVHDLAGSGTAVVVLGACADRATTVRQFEDYADLVGVGSYVVVTDTVVNGRPVWPSFGPGPFEAVKQILNHHGEFAADPDMEKYALSFNPGGFLRRVR
ncbi:MAG TPA: CmcI family methyltransferase [Acidimicrobiales bacterium]|nr:CmcI family methyltransferase [Acidimicrobiales bacterium]